MCELPKDNKNRGEIIIKSELLQITTGADSQIRLKDKRVDVQLVLLC